MTRRCLVFAVYRLPFAVNVLSEIERQLVNSRLLLPEST